jgi:hypothetical protein
MENCIVEIKPGINFFRSMDKLTQEINKITMDSRIKSRSNQTTLVDWNGTKHAAAMSNWRAGLRRREKHPAIHIAI